MCTCSAIFSFHTAKEAQLPRVLLLIQGLDKTHETREHTSCEPVRLSRSVEKRSSSASMCISTQWLVIVSISKLQSPTTTLSDGTVRSERKVLKSSKKSVGFFTRWFGGGIRTRNVSSVCLLVQQTSMLSNDLKDRWLHKRSLKESFEKLTATRPRFVMCGES